MYMCLQIQDATLYAQSNFPSVVCISLRISSLLLVMQAVLLMVLAVTCEAQVNFDFNQEEDLMATDSRIDQVRS